MTGDYKRSKFMAEQVAKEYAESGLPVVIVNPTAPVGDHDFKPTPTGKIILISAREDACVRGHGPGDVDVEDVATGHWLAYERGRPGERYILGCKNLTLEQILQELARASGLEAPRTQIPYALAYAAGVASTAWSRVTGEEPQVPLDAVRCRARRCG
jgi:dihydroflavonol-4-reductase